MSQTGGSKLKALLFIQVWIIFFSAAGQTAPIKFTRRTFQNCKRGISVGVPADCCPPKIQGPIVDFRPQRDYSKPLRVRKALQCLEGKELQTYTTKLKKGYELMRALPEDDPRSFHQQRLIHCAYGAGCFTQDGTGNITIDIHVSWFFLPWHRMYVYFHERILQKLLNDSNFALHFWNFDSSVTGSTKHHGCYKPGHYFPSIYNDPQSPTFQGNRSSRPYTPNLPVDIGFEFNLTPGAVQEFPTLPLAEQVQRNRQAMHRSVITRTLGNTTLPFLGRTLRVGDTRVDNPLLGAGSLEWFAHTSVHFWINGSMVAVQTAPSDPIFFPFHAGVERLWDVWRRLGNEDPCDPDFLNAEFLFWDENAVMRRMRVKETLYHKTITKLGYTYEHVNDDSWIYMDVL